VAIHMLRWRIDESLQVRCERDPWHATLDCRPRALRLATVKCADEGR
jgi:hypothetical protein